MRTWTDLAAIETPVRIARLARDARGYPIPHTVQMRPDGTPDFRVVDPAKWMRAARWRCCGICGEVLGARMAFVGGPLSIENRLFTDLPMHRDCATYALRVCPFLAAPSFAYSRRPPQDTVAIAHVSERRPERFGMGICRDFRLVQLPSTDVALQAATFEDVEWWEHGQQVVPA